MAKSLDQLFEFLLEEIALEGEQGIILKDLVRYVRKFYDESDTLPLSISAPPSASSPSVDRPFLSRLWHWLSVHDDISVGEDYEFNHLSFNEIESLFPGILVDVQLSTSSSTLRPENETPDQHHSPYAEDGPRICASQELVYYAIAGHGPDPTRIFPSEYALLCRIAAARYDGILQGTLGQATGQDKRSVPKRTDALHAKGYIVKRTVFSGGHKTSRLFLHRFAYSYPTSDPSKSRIIRLRDIASHMLSALKDNSLLTQEDLASHLGISAAPTKRVLGQILRHFVRKGCLRKVKSAFAPGSKAGDLKICFQLLRPPSDEDWTTDESVALDLDTPFDDAIAAAEQDEEADVQVLDDGRPAEGESSTSTRTSMPNHRPLWNPDRLFSNVLCDFTSMSGEVGTTNLKSRQQLTGMFVRRPLESLLVRLSHVALKAQPAAVKDIAIVRRHELDDGIAHYVHRSLSVYHEMVKQGTAEWESIEGGKAFAQQLGRTDTGELSGLLQKDKYGLVERAQPKDQIQEGAITIEDLLVSIPAATYTVRSGDLILKETPSGQPCLSTKGPRGFGRPPKLANSAPSSPKKTSTIRSPNVSKISAPKPTKTDIYKKQGRNRKFIEGTRDFWSEMFFALRLQQDPSFPNNGTGYMNDPIALDMFKKRPLMMDKCILQSLEDQLPVPSHPQDINQQWIDQMQTFSHRTHPGVYLTPTGMRGYRRPPRKSRIMVVQSQRLRNLDFADRMHPPPVFLISSSVAHTHRYYRFARWWNNISDARLAEITLSIPGSKRISESPQVINPQLSRPSPPTTPNPSLKQVPTRGVFHENFPSSVTVRTPLGDNHSNLISARNPMDIGSDTDATVTDKEVTRREVKARRRRSKISAVKSDQNLVAKPALPVFNLPVSGRSGRKRKPTQKALETAQVYTIDLSPSSSYPVAENATDVDVETVHNPAVTASHLPAIPTPIPSRTQSPQTLTPPAKGNKGTTAVLAADNPSAERPDGDLIPISSIAEQEKSSNKHPVVLRITPAKLARIVSNLDTKQHKQHIFSTTELETVQGSAEVPTPPASITPSNLHIQENDSVLIQQQIGAPTLNTDDSAIQQWASHIESNEIVSSHPANNGAVPEEQPRVLRSTPDDRDTNQTPKKTRRSSGATSTSVVSNQGSESKSAGAKTTGKNSKKQTHRVVKDPASINEDRTQSTSVGHAPKYLESRYSTPYYRKFIMDLVRMCNGVVPYQPSTLKRVMQPKCIEANIDSNANIKNIKSQIDQLVRSNQLKVMGFAFQRQGMSYTKKVLALPNVQGTDQEFIEMKNKIAALPFEDDYIPPELQAESMRQPSSIRWRDDPDEPSSEGSTAPTPQRKQKKKRQPTSTPVRRGSTKPATARLSFSPEPQPPPANVGFLTLKIPKEKLQALNIGNEFTTHYFRLPAVPLQFEPDTEKVTSATAAPTPASQRRSGIRIARNTKFSSGTGKIQWRTPKLTALPRTIKGILTQERHKQGTENITSETTAFEKFEMEVDLVSGWEQRKWNDLQEPKSGEWIFIKHTVPRDGFLVVNIGEDPVFQLVEFNTDGEEFESELPPSMSWKVFVDALDKVKTRRTKSAATRERQKRKFNEIDGQDGDNDLSDYEDATPRRSISQPANKHKKRKVVKEKLTRDQPKVGTESRGMGMRYLSTEQVHRLSVAIVMVRTLLGGLEQHLDLNLLARVYPDEPLALLRERWKVIRARYMGDVDALGQDFQVKYLDALADEKVPSVNFDNFEGTDWEGILQWAVLNISKDGSKDLEFELPPTRDELVTLNDLKVDESAPMRNLYTHTVAYAVPSREEAWCTVVFGESLSTNVSATRDSIVPKLPHEDIEPELAMARARSWVLAAILTPNHSFDPSRAHSKLLKLAGTKSRCEHLIDAALKRLQSDKFVVKANNSDAEITIDGKTYSGTYGWKICSKFFDRLNSQRFVSPWMLKRAVKYKIDVIDAAFAEHKTMAVAKDADIQDGDMVAILNLLSMDMVRISPGSDVPASRYGLDWERQEYKTKSMDKNLLGFTTVLEPTPSYVYADPLLSIRQTIAIPRGGIDQQDGFGLIPVWFDIHHDFRPEIWEMVLGAIAGLVSVRPGISSVEIVRTLAWALPLGDVDMVLQFLFECHCVQRVYTGWETTEWWWLVIGTGHASGVVWNTGNGA